MTKLSLRIPDKLVPVFEGDAGPEGGLQVRGAHGGRGSAKTRTFAKMAAAMVYKWDRAGITGLFGLGRENLVDVGDSAMAEVIAAIQEEPQLAPHFIINEAGTSVKTRSGNIEFIATGLKASSIRAIKSKARLLAIWVEEAETIGEPVWRTLIPTLRDEGVAELWLTWNPEEERSATQQRFRHNPPTGAKIVEMNWRDNYWFPKVLNLQRLDDKLRFPDTYDHVWEGGYLKITEGAFFTRLLQQAETQGRICRFPIERHLPVFTFWDLGVSDDTSIWFMQPKGKELRFIDFHTNNGEGLEHYIDHCKDVQEKHDFRAYGKHFGPHDVDNRNLATGRNADGELRSLKEWAAQEHNFVFHTVPRVAGKPEGIEAVRQILPSCFFHEEFTKEGVEALRAYRRAFDKDNNSFKKEPLHNWASNPADAFQTFATGWEDGFVASRSPIDAARELAASRGGGWG